MLKMKEMSLSYSEAYHFLEFRHGPMAMVNANTLVAGLISDSGGSHEIAVLRQMRDQGARVLSITESDTAQLSEWSHVVPLNSGLPNWARSVLYLPVLQTMAYYRAMARGVNPDHPANLEAFVSLDNLTPDA
jgi:glucosamine--fructose-6-phosphate aminotransferase (isomerizing)